MDAILRPMPLPLHLSVSVLFYSAIPWLVVLAYRDWTKRIPDSLSNWRSRLGLTSLLVISASWCSIIFLIVADKANLGWARSIETWFNYLVVAPIVAALLALALKGRARTCAFAASLSMALYWATSWVVE